MMRPLKSVAKYYSKGFFLAYGLLSVINLPEFDFSTLVEQSLIFGIGMALLIHAFEDLYKTK
jgi:hypothetical protein